MNEEVVFISKDSIDRQEAKYGWNLKYEKLRAGEVVEIDGRRYKMSEFNGASPLNKRIYDTQ